MRLLIGLAEKSGKEFDLVNLKGMADRLQKEPYFTPFGSNQRGSLLYLYMYNGTSKNINYSLIVSSIIRGDIPLFLYLYNKFSYTKDDFINFYGAACYYDQLSIVKIIQKYAHSYIAEGFRDACRGNAMSVVNYYYNNRIDDATGLGYMGSVKCGNIDMARHLLANHKWGNNYNFNYDLELLLHPGSVKKCKYMIEMGGNPERISSVDDIEFAREIYHDNLVINGLSDYKKYNSYELIKFSKYGKCYALEGFWLYLPRHLRLLISVEK